MIKSLKKRVHYYFAGVEKEKQVISVVAEWFVSIFLLQYDHEDI